MKKLAVCADFVTEKYHLQIRSAAAETGFSVDFYPNDDALAPSIGEYEVIYGHPKPHLLCEAKSLHWLCCDYAGIEKYLDPSLWPNGDCLLSNSSGAYGPTISEHIVMALLMLLRRMPEYRQDLEQRRWVRYTPIRSIIGSHFVLLGTGDIGSNTARRLKALGARVTGVCRSGVSDCPDFDRVISVSELDSVLPEADALIMSLPATAETVGILSRQRLAALPPHAFIVNVGRGSAIDQDALVEALQQGRLAGAALDVTVPEPLPADHPLWTCPNTIITPHISGNMSLGLTCDLDADLFCEDLRRYAAGLPLKNLVDRQAGY